MPIQDIPLRIPAQWDPSWFGKFVRDVLVPMDTRNSTGQGITVTSDGNSVANIISEVTQTVLDDTIGEHVAEANPHSQYLTQAEGEALFAALTTFNSLAARFRFGAGTPEGNVTADVGTMFLRSDGSGANEIVYVKTSGSAATGWTAMTVP